MRAIPSFLLAGAALCAQSSVVFPSTHATIANGVSTNGWYPFANGIGRYQIVYEDWDLGVPANTPITRVGFRQDDLGVPLPQRLLNLEVRMGVTNQTAASLGTDFGANYAAPPTVVFPQGLYTLPAINVGNPIVFWVNLTTPYQYPGGNLLVEFRVFGNNNGNAAFSYFLDEASFVSPVTAGVSGCPHSGGLVPTLVSGPTAVGSTWLLSLLNGPANSPVVLFVAPGQQLTAPYSLSILGLSPLCQGQLPLAGLVTLGASTDAGGYHSWATPVPPGLTFNGYFMTSQVAALDFFVPGSLVVSNADQIQFGIDPPSAMLWSQGSATSPSGKVTPIAAVSQFNCTTVDVTAGRRRRSAAPRAAARAAPRRGARGCAPRPRCAACASRSRRSPCRTAAAG